MTSFNAFSLANGIGPLYKIIGDAGATPCHVI